MAEMESSAPKFGAVFKELRFKEFWARTPYMLLGGVIGLIASLLFIDASFMVALVIGLLFGAPAGYLTSVGIDAWRQYVERGTEWDNAHPNRVTIDGAQRFVWNSARHRGELKRRTDATVADLFVCSALLELVIHGSLWSSLALAAPLFVVVKFQLFQLCAWMRFRQQLDDNHENKPRSNGT